MKLAHPIHFLPFLEMHVPLMRDWLTRDHIRPVWQETEDEAEFKRKFLSELPQRDVYPFVFTEENQPLGYIQYYRAHNIGGGWWPDEPKGTYGIDLLIGESSNMGRGLGPLVITEFMKLVRRREPDLTNFIIDPEPTNTRAIRAYEKVGFIREGEMTTPNGAALLLRLSIDKS